MDFKKLTTAPGREEKKPSTAPFFFQPKLTVNQPGDVYEQEADHVADKVMKMADPLAGQDPFFKSGSKTGHGGEGKNIQLKENTGNQVQSNDNLDSYVGNLGSSGQALPAPDRAFFEQRMGHDFSNVRLYTGEEAAESAQSINALAYTSGNNIVFNRDQYAPGSDSGRKLIAHELTHVVQQGENVVAREVIQRTPGVDAADSFKDIINVSMDSSVVNDVSGKTARRDEAIKRMMSTTSGAGLINHLWKVACKKPPCGKINVTFTDDLSTCPESTGCFRPSAAKSFPYTVLVGNVLPPPPTRSRTLSSTWGKGDNAVVWHHTDPESAMANTLFHELLHITFVNNPNHDPNMPTGHGDPEKGEIDPRFSGYMQEYNNQLDAKETEIHNKKANP